MTSVFVAPRRPSAAQKSPTPAPRSAVKVAERAWPQGVTPPTEVRPPTFSPLFTTDQAAD